MQRSIRAASGRLARLVAAVGVGALLTVGMSGVAAAAEPVTGQPTSESLGDLGKIRNAKSGNTVRVNRITLKFDADGRTVLAYCINFRADLAQGKTYTETGWTASKVADLGKIQWVLSHSYPARSVDDVVSAGRLTKPEGFTPEELNTLAYVGTQATIWSFSDAEHFALQTTGDDPEAADTRRAAARRFISALYTYLRAQATDEPEPVGSLTINPTTATGHVGDKIGPFTVTSTVGDVTVRATGAAPVDKAGKPLTTLKNGEKFWLSCTAAGPVTLDAAAKFNVPIGRVFTLKQSETTSEAAFTPTTKPKPAQQVILAGFAGKELTAKATATCTAKPGLPVTGAPVAGTVAAGLVLLSAGAGLFMVRRRRIRFTA